MGLTALLLVVGSSLGWAALDALRKQLGARMSATVAVVGLNLGQTPFYVAWAVGGGAAFDAGGYAAPGVTLLVINTLANVLFVHAVTVSPLSLTVPFLALTPVFTAGVATVLLDEWPDPAQYLGILVVVAAALLLNATREDGLHPAQLWRALRRERGSLLMIGVAFLWSVAVVLDKVCLQHAAVPMHAALQCSAMGLALVGWLFVRRRAGELRAVRQSAGLMTIGVGACLVALGLQLLALQVTYASFLEAVKRAIGLAAAVAVGRLAFGEPISPRKAALVAVMAAGAALVVAG